MGRNRVRSFIAQFSAPHRDSRTPTPASSPKTDAFPKSQSLPPNFQDSSPDSSDNTPLRPALRDPASDSPSAASSATTPSDGEHAAALNHLADSPSSSPAGRSSRRSSRPLSMVQTYQPPLMAVTEQTLPELQPIFTLLNSHSNKLYQEGYFLKLDDQDIRGQPNPDRTWTECFAQLVGTVLSLWDAAELDAAGEDGEVLPKFINLTDASIKMIESLPTKSNDEQPLQNILSISTAGRNRYLLHFNSHHSLIQWTSGIRLAMYEHSTLQEAYTGALVAGKGKALNNINIIMERARQPIQEWVRVRFGAGVPWRRCYCVIEPPSEKEYQKAQKEHKKRSPYDRHGPILKGEIRFFDTKKEADKKKKHQRPIASITDAYSAYAIYPQAKELIDSSTLLKLEGDITIHSQPPSSTEGFVFIMPETHPAVSGFEMLLRFLFPTWDTFALYGRPGRLVASTLDPRSLMFAMPKHRRYGYLEILDVSGLILTNGSSGWAEREWRKRLKELTGQRVTAMEDGAGSSHSRSASRSSKRMSYGAQPAGGRPRVGFAEEGGSVRSSRSLSVSRPGLRTDSAPPDPNRERAPSALAGHAKHSRNISDTLVGETPAPLTLDTSFPTAPRIAGGPERVKAYASDLASTPERVSSEDDSPVRGPMANDLDEMQRMRSPEPVNAPPAFAHAAGSRPQQKPYPSPEMRRATNRLSNTTLSQLAKAGGLTPDAFTDESQERHLTDGGAGPGPTRHNDPRGLAVQPPASANAVGMNANFNGSREVLTSPPFASSPRDVPGPPPPLRDPARQRSNSPLRGPPPPRDPAGAPNLAFRPAPQGPPPPGGRYPPSGGRRTPSPGPNRQPNSPGAGGSPPVHRKPLPARTTSLSREGNDRAPPIPQHGSAAPFRQLDGLVSPPVPTQNPLRQHGLRSADGGFDDASSTASPDYASTRRSSDTQDSVDRPRAGVLKIVGDDGGASSSAAGANKDYDIPDINFGPTLNYGAPVLPVDRSSPSKQQQKNAGHPSGRRSPGPAAALSHARQQSSEDNSNLARRSVVWPGPQPALGTSPRADATTVTPEQFLQQRAAQPGQYAHQRSPSTNTLTDLAGTQRPAAHARHSSTDLLAGARPGLGMTHSHSRHSSYDLLSSGRPPSRGAGAALSPYGGGGNGGGGRSGLHSRSSSYDLLSSATGRPPSQGTGAVLSVGEVSSHLSAREQEHVARVTGSPLVALATSAKPPSQTQAGLVGAIEVRERERAQMRAQGYGGQAVAQAIDQRQRQQVQQQQLQMQQMQMQMQMQQQQAQRAAYAQQQAQFAAAAAGRPQTPGAGAGMGMMMGGGGAPSPYGPPQPMQQGRPQTPMGMGMMMADGAGAGAPSPGLYGPRPQTPGGMGMGMGPGGVAPSVYGAPPSMVGGGVNVRSMSPGPGRFGVPPPQQQQQQWMPQQQMQYGGPMPSPGMGYPQQQPSPGFQMPSPPQGQYAVQQRPGTPGAQGMLGGPARPGTPGRMMQYQGQAF